MRVEGVNEIYESHVGLLYKFMNTLRLHQLDDRDDLFQEASVALWNAIESYDGSSTLSYWAFINMRWAVQTYREKHLTYRVCWNNKLKRTRETHYDGYEFEINEEPTYTPTGYEEAENRVVVRQAFKHLKESNKQKWIPRHCVALALRFGLPPFERPRTLEEVAGFIGTTRERVRQMELNLLNKLRAIMRCDLRLMTVN